MNTLQTNPAGYNDLFLTYLAGTIQQSLERVRAEKYTVPEEDRVQAWHVLSYALEVEALWAETLELLLALAPRMELAGFRYDWLSYLEQGVESGRALGDEDGVARLGLEIGLLWLRMGEHKVARRWLTEAEAIFARHDNPRCRALALNRLADSAQQQGQLDEARRLATAAREMVDEDMPERAYSFFVLGLVDFDQQMLDQAQHNFEEAQRIWTHRGNKRFAALCLQNLGRVYMGREAHDKAVECFENAALTFQFTGDVDRQALVRMNQGVIYFWRKDYLQALKHYKMAEKGFKQTIDTLHLTMLYNNYGLLYLAQQQWEEAKQFFCTSVAQWIELGNDTERLNTVDGLGQALIGLEKYTEATELYKNAIADLYKVNNERRRNQISEKLSTHLQQAQERIDRVEQISPSFS